MSSLLPPTASNGEKALEAATARIAHVPVPLRSVWNPDTCPVDLLPWLAWALSVDSWKSYWPENVKRARIRSALNIQRRKGTAESVRAIVESFGGAAALREWWQYDPPGQPHTFDIVLTLTGEGGEPPTTEFVDDVIAEVSRTKPVRSHFTFTQGTQSTGAIGIAIGARPAVYCRLQFDAVEP